MTIRAELIFALAAIVLLVSSATPHRAAAQASSEVPRTAAGKPDFNGLYEWPRALPGAATCRCSATIFDRKNFAPLLGAEGEPFLEPRTGDPRHDEPRAFCMPAGFPSGMLSANAMQFSQTRDYLIVLHEFQGMKRIIPLDGRPHRKGIEPSYYGDSVGHWEGDTLVVVTKNLKRWSLDDYYYTDPKEYRMHSDALTVTERISFKSPTKLRYVMTLDDPKIFKQPWSQEFEITARPEWSELGLLEYVCEENNRCPGGVCKAN